MDKLTIEDCLAGYDYFVTTKEEEEGLAGARAELATLRAKAAAWDRVCQIVGTHPPIAQPSLMGAMIENVIRQFQTDHRHA